MTVTVTHLAKGAHETRETGMCAMEAAAYIAGEPHSDHPACVCPVIARFMRAWNDALPDADRDRLLIPLLPVVIGTRDPDAEDRRAWMASDWLVREFAPAWLDLVPSLAGHAAALRALPEVTAATVAQCRQPVDAARDAARAAARAAAGDAARAVLAPTVTRLQESAVQLVHRMAGVTQ